MSTVNLLEIKDKEKKSEGSHKKEHITYKGTVLNFYVLVIRSYGGQREWNNIFKAQKKGKKTAHQNSIINKNILKKTKKKLQTSLMVQWSRMDLAMKGSQGQSPVQENPTCCRAAKLRATITEACAS